MLRIAASRSVLVAFITVVAGAVVNFAAGAFDLTKWRWPLFSAAIVLTLLLVVLSVLTEQHGAVLRPQQARPPWNVPGLDGEPVGRPELIQTVTDLVLDRTPTVGMTSALHGAGGFGKTTLAKQVCLRSDVRDAFPGGLLWVTVGQELRGARLAAAIGDLCRELGDARPSLSEPEQAGFRLGELLDDRPRTLLVVDDVWHTDQVRPFQQGGVGCKRLITTRVPSLLPDTAARVLVDEMSPEEAEGLLARGLSEPLSNELNEQLLRLTGRWPLLLGLLHSRLVLCDRQGRNPLSEARRLAAELRATGPAALDLTYGDQRERAVRLTVEASLAMLSPQHRERYAELAIFAEDVDIPREMVRLLWHRTGGVSSSEADRLCRDLAELSLIAAYRDESGTVRLHDVLRSYLRGPADQANLARLALLNGLFLDAACTLLPGAASSTTPVAWWLLPESAGYLWHHLTWHLVEAGRHDQLGSLVCDLRWVEAQLRRDAVVRVEADLQLHNGPTAWALLDALARSAHLLRSTQPPEALADILLSRLDGVPGLDTITADYATHLPARPRLSNAWPLPDRVDPYLRRVLGGHTGEVNSVATAAGARWLASAGDDGTIRVWQLETYSPMAILTHGHGRVLCAAVAPDGAWLASGGADGLIRIWDVGARVQTGVLAGHTDWVRGLAGTPDGTWLASASDDGTVRLWNVAAHACAATLTEADCRVRGLAFAPDGAWLAWADEYGRVQIWDMAARALTATLTGHHGQVWAIAVAPSGAWLASAGDDGAISIWNVADSTCVTTLGGHSARVRGLAISPDGTRMASVGDDATVRTWDAKRYTPNATLLGHTGRVLGVAFSNDGTRVISTGSDATVRVWSSKADRAEDELIGPVWHAAVVPDGASIVSAGFDGVVRLWDVDERTSKAIHGCHVGPVLGVAVAPDGAHIASSGGDGNVKIWDIARLRLMGTLTGHAGWVYGVDYSSDGGWLVSVAADETARIWDTRTYEPTAVLRGHQGEVNAVAVARSDEWVATAGDDATVRIWDAATGTLTATLGDHASPVLGVTVAPDGRWLASGCSDGTVRIWDVAARVSTACWSAHRGPVWAVAAAEDSRWLASAGVDGAVRLWDVATGRCEAMMCVDAALFGCLWLPDGHRIAAVGTKGVYLFRFTAPAGSDSTSVW